MPEAIEPTSVQTSSEVATQDGAPAGPPVPVNKPKSKWMAAISGVLNFVTLGARIVALTTAAALLKESLHLLKHRMHKDAAKARKVSEMCGAAGVDPRFQGQIIEVSQAFDRVADASGDVADAADQMEANAQAVKDAHQAEYGGIYEAVNANPYTQPVPGFNAVR